MQRVLFDLSTTLFALVSGAVLFRKLNMFHRLVLLQVLIYLLVDLMAINQKPDNSAWYNLLIPVETLLLTIAAGLYYQSTRAWWWLGGLYTLFLVILWRELASGEGFALQSAIAEGMLLFVCYVIILVQEINKKESDKSLIVSSLGLVLYFGCSIPYLSLIRYFQRNNPELNYVLFQNIIITLGLLRYLFNGLGFCLNAYAQRDKKQTQTHDR